MSNISRTEIMNFYNCEAIHSRGNLSSSIILYKSIVEGRLPRHFVPRNDVLITLTHYYLAKPLTNWSLAELILAATFTVIADA